MKQEQQDALRAPFPKEKIQQLPVGGTKLDYVSHAWVTDRLLEVDPEWTWEPVGFDEQGLPALDKNGGLWIKLTVCGVTRYGYGEPQGMNANDKIKGAIGNAIRVAAMRFGVALDLWAKEAIVAEDKKQQSVSQNYLKMIERIALSGSIVELSQLVPIIKESKFNTGEADKLRNLFNEKKVELGG